MAQNKQVNQFDISGKAIHVGQPEQFVTKAGKTITTRMLVLEVFSGTYSNEVAFEYSEQNMNQLLQAKEGGWLSITFCLKGNKSLKDGKARWWPKLEGLTCIIG